MENVPFQFHPARFQASRGYTKELQTLFRETITDRFDLDQKVSDLVLTKIQEARKGKPASYLTRFYSNQAVWSNERVIAHLMTVHQISPLIYSHPVEDEALDLKSTVAELKAYKLIAKSPYYIHIGRQKGYELQPGWEIDGAYIRPARRNSGIIITLTAMPPDNWDNEWINQPEPFFTLVLDSDVRTLKVPAAIEQAHYSAIAENNLLAHEVEELENSDKNLAARFQPYKAPSPRLNAILPVATIIASIVYNIQKFKEAYVEEWVGNSTPELVANAQSKMHSTRTAANAELEKRKCVKIYSFSDTTLARIKLQESTPVQTKKSEPVAVEEAEVVENLTLEIAPPAWPIDDLVSTYNNIQQAFTNTPDIHLPPFKLTDCTRFIAIASGFPTSFQSRRYQPTLDEIEIRTNRLREALPSLTHKLPALKEDETAHLTAEQTLHIFSCMFDGETNPSVLLRSVGLPDLKTGFAGAEIFDGGSAEYPLELVEGTGARKRRQAIVEEFPQYEQILNTYIEPAKRDFFNIVFSMTTLVRKDPGSLQAYFILISSLYHMGKYEDALCFFKPIVDFLAKLMKPHKGKTLSSTAGRNLQYIGIFYFYALCQAKIQNAEATFGYSVPILEHAFFQDTDLKSQVKVDLSISGQDDQIDLQFSFTQQLGIA